MADQMKLGYLQLKSSELEHRNQYATSSESFGDTTDSTVMDADRVWVPDERGDTPGGTVKQPRESRQDEVGKVSGLDLGSTSRECVAGKTVEN